MIAQGVATPSVKAIQALGPTYTAFILWLSQWYDWNPHVKRPDLVKNAQTRTTLSLPHPTINITAISKYVINSPPFTNARSVNTTRFCDELPQPKAYHPTPPRLSWYPLPVARFTHDIATWFTLIAVNDFTTFVRLTFFVLLKPPPHLSHHPRPFYLLVHSPSRITQPFFTLRCRLDMLTR